MKLRLTSAEFLLLRRSALERRELEGQIKELQERARIRDEEVLTALFASHPEVKRPAGTIQAGPDGRELEWEDPPA